MSEPSLAAPQTIFEKIWQQPAGHLFRSEKHQVMAIADAFPRMPLQVVVAPAYGTPGVDAHFNDLPLPMQRKLAEVGFMIGHKILQHCTPSQRAMFTLEGFAVKDHAHVVHYAGERGQGIDRYTGPMLGQTAVEHTIEAIVMSDLDTHVLESRLDRVDRASGPAGIITVAGNTALTV